MTSEGLVLIFSLQDVTILFMEQFGSFMQSGFRYYHGFLSTAKLGYDLLMMFDLLQRCSCMVKCFLLEFQPWYRKKYCSKGLGEIVCLFQITRMRPHAVKGIWGHYEGILVKEADISCIFPQLIHVYREGKKPNTLEIHVLHTFDSWFFIHQRQASYLCTPRKKMKGVFYWWIDVWYLLIAGWSGGRWREMTPNCFLYSRMPTFLSNIS